MIVWYFEHARCNLEHVASHVGLDGIIGFSVTTHTVGAEIAGLDNGGRGAKSELRNMLSLKDC